MPSRRLNLITVLLALIAVVALALGGFRLFKPRSAPTPGRFDDPAGGFTITFPEGPPEPADLVAALNDLDRPGGDDRRGGPSGSRGWAGRSPDGPGRPAGPRSRRVTSPTRPRGPRKSERS